MNLLTEGVIFIILWNCKIFV